MTKKTKVAYDTVYKNTDSLDKGKTKVDTEGKSGQRTVDLHAWSATTARVKQTKKSSKITRKATDQVVAGRAPRRRRSRSSGGSTGGELGLGQARPVRVRRQLVASTPATASTAACSSRLAPGARTAAAGCRNQASRAQQIAVAKKLQAACRAGGQWPACTCRSCGLR